MYEFVLHLLKYDYIKGITNPDKLIKLYKKVVYTKCDQHILFYFRREAYPMGQNFFLGAKGTSWCARVFVCMSACMHGVNGRGKREGGGRNMN